MADQRAPKVSGKKDKKVGLNLDPALYVRLARACSFQQHRDGQLARILVEWALPYYEQARGVDALNLVQPVVPSGRVSRETQELLFTALRTILDRAPSASKTLSGCSLSTLEDMATKGTAKGRPAEQIIPFESRLRPAFWRFRNGGLKDEIGSLIDPVPHFPEPKPCPAVVDAPPARRQGGTDRADDPGKP